MFDLAKEIWQTMRTNKLRTFLTGISVAWGIFMLILLLAVSNGVVNMTRDFSESNDPNRITVWGGVTSMPYEGLKEGREIKLRDKYVPALTRADSHHITKVEASVGLNGTISTNKDYIAGEAEGVYPSAFNGQYTLRQGRYINDADLRMRRKVIVLPSTDVPTLFRDTTDVVGQVVKLADLAFIVVGVYDHPWANSRYIPYTTAEALTGYNGDVNSYDVYITGVADETQSAAVEQQIVGTMAREAKFDPADPSAVNTFDHFASYLSQIKATGYLNVAMWVIGLLTLVTGIVGVSNIMFVSVRERTHEIGIRRAIGARPRSILVQVVLESVVLTTVFGYIGIVMGTLATEGVKAMFAGGDVPLVPQVDLSIALQVTVALIVAGALAGLFPAMRAIKVKPVEALMEE